METDVSKLFDLFRVHRGKRIKLMTGDRSAVRNRMARLKKDASFIKGQPCKYAIEPAGTGATKFKKKPHNPRTGGGDAQTPRLTKWNG